MALTITMYPAGNGDTFLIRYAPRDERPTVILIDGGYVSTFRDHVLPDLARLAQSGGMVDLAVATHIDADHVSGLIHFFKENGPAEEPRIIPVHEVWHNSLRSIPTRRVPPEESGESSALSQGDSEILQMVSSRGYPRPVGENSAASEISAHQGSSLAALLLGGGYQWNGEAGRMPIVASPRTARRIGPDIDVTVLGPTPIRLEELSDWWMTELRHLGYAGSISPDAPFDDAFEFLVASENVSDSSPRLLSGRRQNLDPSLPAPELAQTYAPDTSIPNGSSISLLVRVGGMRVLLLGDAWAPDTEAAIREAFASDESTGTGETAGTAGAEPPPGEGGAPLVFDAIKISHHGSCHNTSPDLLGQIDAPRFLISTNGERHNHPDIEVLRAIVDRPAPFRRELFFSHRTSASEWMKHYSAQPGAVFSVHEGVREIHLGEEGEAGV